MKYMKLGILPDTFYTEAAARTVLSEVPSDLTIQINNAKYKLHKFPLLRKCGLLQHLCSNADYCCDDAAPAAAEKTTPPILNLHDLPGGEEAFEFCAKFCYGISIKLSAHNFVPAIRAAKYLRMSESVSKGNLVSKLECFFDACILPGWKDSIVALQATSTKRSEARNDCCSSSSSSEKVGKIVHHRCADSIVSKILTHPSKVTWSYTYTRPGFDKKRRQQQHQRCSAPKDWWTEDVSELDLDLFRSIISAVRSTKQLPPALIGEALHVYACKHLRMNDPIPAPHHHHLLLLPAKDQNTNTSVEDVINAEQSRRRTTLESIVSMMPVEQGAVSCSFLLKLLNVANLIGGPAAARAELVRRSGRRLQEATVKDLLFPLPTNHPQSSSSSSSYDVGLVEAVLEIFLLESQHRQSTPEVEEEEEDANNNNNSNSSNTVITSMRKVATTIDGYLQVIAHNNADLAVSRFVDLAQALPELARPEHDELYRAVDIYLKEHPELSKEEKKQLCTTVDCRKLSSGVRSEAMRNDRLPLRTIVQALVIEQDKAAGTKTNSGCSHETLHASSFLFKSTAASRISRDAIKSRER